MDEIAFESPHQLCALLSMLPDDLKTYIIPYTYRPQEENLVQDIQRRVALLNVLRSEQCQLFVQDDMYCLRSYFIIIHKNKEESYVDQHLLESIQHHFTQLPLIQFVMRSHTSVLEKVEMLLDEMPYMEVIVIHE